MLKKSFICDEDNIDLINKNNVLKSLLDIYNYCLNNYVSKKFGDVKKNWKVYNLYYIILRKIRFYEKCLKNEWKFCKYNDKKRIISYNNDNSDFYTLNRKIYDDYDIITYCLDKYNLSKEEYKTKNIWKEYERRREYEDLKHYQHYVTN